MKSGYLNDLNLNNFTVATVDNIDFLPKHSFVFHGDQSRSWHGTTIQVVQPLGSSYQSCSNMECSMTAEQDQQLVEHSPNPSAIGKKRTTRPASEPSPTPTSKSPANKKVTRRSRSLVECKTPPTPTVRRLLFPTANKDSFTQLSCNLHYSTLKSNHSLQEFCLTETEKKELKDLEEMALLYMIYR